MLFSAVSELGDHKEADALWRAVMSDRSGSRAESWASISNHLEHLANSRPKSGWLLRARGYSLMRLEKPEDAEVDFGKAIQINPNDGWSYLGRALARRERGHHENAFADLTRAAELEPRVARTWSEMGEIDGLRSHWDDAARDYAHWAELGGEPIVDDWYRHALLRLHARDREGYRRACRALWELFAQANDPFVASIAARACTLENGCGVPASDVVALAEKAWRAHPRDGWYLTTLGSALLRAGRIDDAIARYAEAQRVAPDWSGAPMIDALRDRARCARGSQEQVAPRWADEPAVDFATLMDRMANAKPPWNLAVEAKLLIREHDEKRAEAVGKPGGEDR
jgi:tetratricopeptide (TPR) repeat protein